MKMSVAEKPKQPMKAGFWEKVGAVRRWIADKVKAFFEYLWKHVGWKLFAIVFCSLVIALVVAWFIIR